jgi:polysaccharide pyruvyl transferase WcaK-like protein
MLMQFINEGSNDLEQQVSVAEDSACSEPAVPKPGLGPRVCLLGATFGTANMGVSALTVGAVKVVMRRWPGAQIFMLDYGTAPCTYDVDIDRECVAVRLVNLRFSKKFYLGNHILVLLALSLLFRLLPEKRFRDWLCQRNPWLAKVADADLAVSVAAGDSFSDIYGLTNFFYIVLPQILCLILRKRLILFPQTFGPFKSRISRAVARYILRRAEWVYSRDLNGLKTTQDLAGRQCSGPPARFSYDLGILLHPRPVRDSDFEALLLRMGTRTLVGLNVSGLLSASGGKFGTRAAFASDYDFLVKDLIRYLIRSMHASVLLVPHVFGSGIESDSALCEKLFSELSPEYPDCLGIVRGPCDQHEIKYLIGSCDFFIGSRMHACIAAVSQGVPAVSLAYSDKFAGVMEAMGLASLVADLRTMKPDEVLQVVRSAFEERESHRTGLIQQMPKWKKSALEILDEVELVVIKPERGQSI